MQFTGTDCLKHVSPDVASVSLIAGHPFFGLTLFCSHVMTFVYCMRAWMHKQVFGPLFFSLDPAQQCLPSLPCLHVHANTGLRLHAWHGSNSATYFFRLFRRSNLPPARISISSLLSFSFYMHMGFCPAVLVDLNCSWLRVCCYLTVFGGSCVPPTQ